MAKTYFSNMQSASQRNSNYRSKLAPKAIIFIVILVVILGSGAYTSRRLAWGFTPAYQSRKLTNKFLAATLADKPQVAYALTSEHLQQLNSYNSFSSSLAVIKNSNVEIKPVTYKVKSDKSVVIVGTLIDSKTKEIKLFGLTTSDKGTKVDAVTVVDTGVQSTSALNQEIEHLATSL